MFINSTKIDFELLRKQRDMLLHEIDPTTFQTKFSAEERADLLDGLVNLCDYLIDRNDGPNKE